MQLDLLREDYRLTESVSVRARNIRIEIRAAGEVRLVIPRWASRKAAYEFLHSREAWIRQKLAQQRLRQAHVPVDRQEMNWDGRDLLPLRGVEQAVRVEAASLRQISVRFDADGIRVFCPTTLLAQRERLARALRDALKHQALLDARRYLDAEAARLGIRYSGPRIADQKTLWGSCAARGLISLSWRLVLAPPEVFRYVVIHELCHIRHHDHSDAFWALVAQQMPGYEAHYRWLREQGARLHLYLAQK